MDVLRVKERGLHTLKWWKMKAYSWFLRNERIEFYLHEICCMYIKYLSVSSLIIW
jgi:hypothetical protein